MRSFLILFSLVICLSTCESSNPATQALNATKLIQDTKYQFQQPLALRENLLAERGFESIDSLAWLHLDLQQKTTYNSASSYYILGKLSPINELFSSLILLEDHPSFSRAWIITYNTLGHRIDQLLVYNQRQPTPLRISGYLRDNQVELSLEGSLKKRYQLTEAGTFSLIIE